MPLSGINKKCAKCIEKCKQWAQVKVIICPNWKPCGHQAQENGGNATFPQENRQIGILSTKQGSWLKKPLNAKSGGEL
jgi:hypothetical protein